MTELPHWNKNATILQISFFLFSFYAASVAVNGCCQAFKYGTVYEISPWDEELLNSWGIDSFPQLLIDVLIVSFLASIIIQGLILGIPLIQLRKEYVKKKSLASMIFMFLPYLDFNFPLILFALQMQIYPASRVISILMRFISAGVLLGGLATKLVVNLAPLLWRYVVYPATNDKTHYLVKRRI